jgi:hypothetical protein
VCKGLIYSDQHILFGPEESWLKKSEHKSECNRRSTFRLKKDTVQKPDKLKCIACEFNFWTLW